MSGVRHVQAAIGSKDKVFSQGVHQHYDHLFKQGMGHTCGVGGTTCEGENSPSTQEEDTEVDTHTDRLGGQADKHPPVTGSGGRSDSLLLEETEDLTGTGKNPRRKRATPITSNIKINEAKTDERTFILPAADGNF